MKVSWWKLPDHNLIKLGPVEIDFMSFSHCHTKRRLGWHWHYSFQAFIWYDTKNRIRYCRAGTRQAFYFIVSAIPKEGFTGPKPAKPSCALSPTNILRPAFVWGGSNVLKIDCSFCSDVLDALASTRVFTSVRTFLFVLVYQLSTNKY